MLKYRKDMHGETAIFALEDSLSLEETADLRKVFWECLNGDQIKKLVVDLAELPSLDPSLISLFVATKNVVSKRKGQLVLVGVNAENLRLLEQTHLDHYFDIRETVDQAFRDPTPPAS